MAALQSAPFFNGVGKLFLDVFVHPGELIGNLSAAGALSRLPNVMMMWTSSGPMQGDGDGIGSWHAATKRFGEKAMDIHSPWSKKIGFRVPLFLDGANVHLER